MKATGLIILSGGGSTRMGTPKQLLNVQGKTLLERILSNIESIPFTCQVIVLGSVSTNILPTSLPKTFHLALNNEWTAGMGSSIRCGMEALLDRSSPEQVLFLVSDQPYVNGELIKNMLKTADRSDKGIIACAYRDTLGVPVLFKSAYFSSLLNLKGQKGAKGLLTRYPDDVGHVPFPLGHVDLDTPDDYAAYLKGDIAHFDRKTD